MGERVGVRALAILLAVWVYSRLPAAGDVRPTGVPVPASTVRLVPAPSPAQPTPQMDIVPHTGYATADLIGELVLGASVMGVTAKKTKRPNAAKTGCRRP